MSVGLREALNGAELVRVHKDEFVTAVWRGDADIDIYSVHDGDWEHTGVLSAGDDDDDVSRDDVNEAIDGIYEDPDWKKSL